MAPAPAPITSAAAIRNRVARIVKCVLLITKTVHNSATFRSVLTRLLDSFDRRAGDVFDGRSSALLHGQPQFGAQDIQDPLHAFLTEGRQAINVGAADADGARAPSQRPADISAAPEPAV